MTAAPRLAIAQAPNDVPDAVPSLCWSANQLGAALGVAPRTVRKLHASGRIPRPIRLGRAVRWRADEVRAWLAAGAPPRDRWEASR